MSLSNMFIHGLPGSLSLRQDYKFLGSRRVPGNLSWLSRSDLNQARATEFFSC